MKSHSCESGSKPEVAMWGYLPPALVSSPREERVYSYFNKILRFTGTGKFLESSISCVVEGTVLS